MREDRGGGGGGSGLGRIQGKGEGGGKKGGTGEVGILNKREREEIGGD